eukprot:28896_1
MRSLIYIFIMITPNLYAVWNVTNSTTFPTIPPTNIPTLSPSKSPSVSPTTNSPTEQTETPTAAPTFTPTNTPTYSPTRHPTGNIYNNVLHIDYNLTNITRNITTQLTTDQSVVNGVTRNIEASYLLYSRRIIDDKTQWLQYKDFDIIIVDVCIDVNECSQMTASSKSLTTQYSEHDQYVVTNYSVLLRAFIYYFNTSVATNIRFISKQNGFQNFTQYRLRKYFNYFSLYLLIGRPSEDDNDGSLIEQINPVFMVTIVIGFICVCLGTVSFIYNNLIPNAKTDNGNSIAVPLYGLQMVDLFSDVNLCAEMFLQFNGSKYHTQRMTLYFAAFGSLVFTVIPYITNLVMASSIKNLKVIKRNPFAKSYFQTTSWFFIVLVVFCGGMYPALSIVSSRLFAFEFLNSGLTAMELTKLTKVRFFGTVLLENIPQLIFSGLYIGYRGSPSSNTILSIIMSILQILAAIVNFIVMRIPTDCHIVCYDLEMKV